VALVVLLRGVNVGGHRTFRPSVLAAQLKHLDVVNIGAAGTFVIRRPVSHAQVRAEFARRLPFETRIVICEGRDIVKLMSREAFSAPLRPGVVGFVSVLTQSRRGAPSTPLQFPATGQWMVKILARDKRFVVGMYRRHMKVIGYLGRLDEVFGAPVTTRNWNTLNAIARVLERRTSAQTR
jgi:uncharacterized protein (DUF1697 family)